MSINKALRAKREKKIANPQRFESGWGNNPIIPNPIENTVVGSLEIGFDDLISKVH